MHLRSSLALAAAAVLSSAPEARAEPGEWYGYQVLTTDLLGWSLVLAGVGLDVGPVAGVGAGFVLLGGPLVHIGHGNYEKAGYSAAWRYGGILAGALVGTLLAGSTSGSDNTLGMIALGGLGGFAGYIVGAITDIAFIAREPGDTAESAPRMFTIGGRF